MKQFARVRVDAILASFVVAIISSFLIAMAMLLLKALSIGAFERSLFADITVNLLILIFFGAFVFVKGSVVTAWLLYRHDVPWGYELPYSHVTPILLTSFLMALSIYCAVYLFTTDKITTLAYVSRSVDVLNRFGW